MFFFGTPNLEALSPEALHRDRRTFVRAYRHLTKAGGGRTTRPPQSAPGIDAGQVGQMVDGLRSTGLAVWRGLFADPEFIAAGKAALEEFSMKCAATFDGQPADVTMLQDPESGAVFNRASETMRTRTYFYGPGDNAPPPIRRVLTDPNLQEVASRYFDRDTACQYVLAEKLQPGTPDRWHMDRIVDQIKVMVLLTDVAMEDGPLRYKLTTHRAQKALGEIYHETYRNGVSSAYPPDPLVSQLPGDIVFGTGKAGDAFIFDTVGVHSGTKCESGQRLGFVANYVGETPKTQFFNKMAPGRWI